MNEHEATEVAFKNGYKQGVKDTVRKIIKRIKEDAITVSILSNPPKFVLEIREDDIDLIAKEILEGIK